MTSIKYLSNKKTAQQTFSLSPALKVLIKRFVNVNHRKTPEEDKFRSVSSFIAATLAEKIESYKENKGKIQV